MILFMLAGLITLLISLKVFIAVTMIVGNIIYIYLFSLIIIFISLLFSIFGIVNYDST